MAERAIEYALAAHAYDQAARLIEENAASFTRQGRFTTLNRWLQEIPREMMLTHPVLNILGSRAMVLSGKLTAGEQLLEMVESAHRKGAASLSPALRGQIASVRATAAILNADLLRAKEQAQLAMELLPPADPSRAAVLLSFGDASLMSGEITGGIQLLREAVEQCRRDQDLSILLTAFAHLAEGLWMLGRLRQVEAVCLEAIDEVNGQLGAGDWPLPSLALLYTLLGGVHREWNALDMAEQQLTKAVDIAEKNNSISASVNAYTGLAALRRSQGQLSQAIELIEKGMQALHQRESHLFLSVAQAQRADYWAQTGNMQAAQRWVTQRQLSAERPFDYLGDFELYALTRIWISNNHADQADALAGRLVTYAEDSGRLGRAIDFLVLQTLARRQAGRLDFALQSLERALELGEEEGYLRTFLDEGHPMIDLLLQISRKKSRSSAYARRLLSLSQTSIVGEQTANPSSALHKGLIEPLTPRELVVLRQIASGDSNQEIAQRLVISVGTVKAHIYHLSAKLGARSRTEAVARAREAGLLP